MRCPLGLLSLVPFAIALQSIYLGTDSASGQSGTYIAFFSDSDPCPCKADGTRFGYLPAGFNDCNENLTILGHPNITFTGCKPYTGYPGSLPTGVFDGGAHALNCVGATAPPSQYGVFASCGADSTKNAGFVQLLEFCS